MLVRRVRRSHPVWSGSGHAGDTRDRTVETRRRPARHRPPDPAAGGRPGRAPGPAGRLPLPGRHPHRTDQPVRRARQDTRRPRRHRGLRGRARSAAAGPEPRARVVGQRVRRAARARHGLRHGRRERRRLHDHRDRRRGPQPRRAGRHLRHADQLRRRADPVGHLAHLRGDRDPRGHRVERRRPQRHVPEGPRLRLRGLPRPIGPAGPGADQGLRPVRARGPGDQPRPYPRLPVRGRQRPERAVLPVDRSVRRTARARLRQPARPDGRPTGGDEDRPRRRVGAAGRRLHHLGPAGPAVPGPLGRGARARRQHHLGPQAVRRRPGDPGQEVRGRVRHQVGRVRRLVSVRPGRPVRRRARRSARRPSRPARTGRPRPAGRR